MKLSDFGSKMRVVPALEFNFALVTHDQLPPHFHLHELRRMHAQVVACPGCGFWVPIGARCPSCGLKR